MGILEISYNNIPQNRLDKPLSLFLQGYNVDNIQYPIIHLSPVLEKVKKVSEIKKIFPAVVKTSRTNDVVRILELLSFNLVKFLNKAFEPFFSNLRYANSLEILNQRASGFTLQDIAAKKNKTRERIRQIELKSTEKLMGLIKALKINIVSFICIDTGNFDYISAATIREYLEEFKYSFQLIYLLENENIYNEYQYNRQYDVFYRTGLELDFSSLNIQRPVKELALNDKEVEIGKKIEDFLIAKNLMKCTYNDICNFTDSEVAGYAKVGKIIQLTNNIVEIEKDWYVHKSCIIDFDEAAEKLLAILKNQFRQFYGYSNSHILFDAAGIDLAMFMNDNGFETEQVIYMLAKHLFFKEKYNNHNFIFTENLHIWEKQTDFPQNTKGVLINFAKATGGIITREEAEKYLENLKFPKDFIIRKIHDISDSTFYFYEPTIYIFSEHLQIDNAFISKVKKSLDKLFDDREYIIPRDIDEDWFDTLPKLPLGLFWNLLLLQEIIRHNEEIGYKPLFSDIDQSPYRISGAFVRADAVATLVDIIHNYTYEYLELPYKDTTENYRKLLVKAGFIQGLEWFNGMHKVFNDPHFAFSNENKSILVRK
jgi:ribosomal protein S8